MYALDDVAPHEVKFLELLHSSEKSLVYLVNARDQECAMKIHRGQEKPGAWGSCFLREKRAYERLDSAGLTTRGIVPKYFGSREQLEKGLWSTHLKEFEEDAIRPSALFLEYIPKISRFWDPIQGTQVTLNRIATTLTVEKQKLLREMFVQFLSAGVLHSDLKLRNLTITDDDRMLWMEFDTADVRPRDDSVPAEFAPYVDDTTHFWERNTADQLMYLDSFFEDINQANADGDFLLLRKYIENCY